MEDMKRAGRPRVTESSRGVNRFTIDMPVELYEELLDFAKSRHISMKVVICAALEDAFDNPEFHEYFGKR